jgi:sec-independent protein translocase protein TatC
MSEPDEPKPTEKTPSESAPQEAQAVPYEYGDFPPTPSQMTADQEAEPRQPESALPADEPGTDPYSLPAEPAASAHDEDQARQTGQTEQADEVEEDKESELGAKMTFLEHLDELRRRIIRIAIGLAVGFGVCWGFRDAIFAFIRAPIDKVVTNLVITSPTQAFTIFMKVAFVGGVFLAAPYVLLQVWLFIAPGLYRREKRWVLPYLLSSTTLFLLGGAFAYYIILPPALQFLILEFGKAFQPMITAMDYFDLVIVILIGMGAVFQLPVLIAFLSMFGLITPRFLWKNFRYAFLLIVTLAAIVSPTTDPFNLFLWTAPMVVLYLLGIVIAWIFKRRRAKRDAQA